MKEEEEKGEKEEEKEREDKEEKREKLRTFDTSIEIHGHILYHWPSIYWYSLNWDWLLLLRHVHLNDQIDKL